MPVITTSYQVADEAEAQSVRDFQHAIVALIDNMAAREISRRSTLHRKIDQKQSKTISDAWFLVADRLRSIEIRIKGPSNEPT